MSFVCEYLGLLEPLRNLIMDLSRGKHIRVLILFVTIKISVFGLSAIISANLLENLMHSFPIPPFAAKTRGVRDPFSIYSTGL